MVDNGEKTQATVVFLHGENPCLTSVKARLAAQNRIKEVYNENETNEGRKRASVHTGPFE